MLSLVQRVTIQSIQKRLLRHMRIASIFSLCIVFLLWYTVHSDRYVLSALLAIWFVVNLLFIHHLSREYDKYDSALDEDRAERFGGAHSGF